MKKEKKRKVKKRTTTDRDRLIISMSDRFLMLYTCDAVDEIMGFIYLIMTCCVYALCCEKFNGEEVYRVMVICTLLHNHSENYNKN